MSNISEKTEKKYEQKFLSREHTGMLRGIAIIIIVAVHFLNIYTDFSYFSMFAGVGVSIFLIISGYGISESYKRKGLERFFSDKLLKIYLPAWIVLLVFMLIDFNISPTGFLKSFLLIGLKAGWYLQFLFILYALFFISAKLFKKKYYILFLFVPLAFIFIPSQLWAEQAVCFSAGILVSHFCLSEKYDKNNFRYFISAFFGCLLLAVSAFALRHHLPGFYVFNNICWLVFKTSLAIAVILATQFVKASYTTKLFGYIGKYSFAVYLIHLYIFEIIFKYSFTPITIALAFVIITVLSIVYTILINKLYTSVKRRMKNEQT